MNQIPRTESSETEGARCLDMGCGSAPAFAPAEVQVGLDIDLESLRQSRRMYPRAHFVCADGHYLPFRDSVFEDVISRVALPLMNLNLAIPEISRVLTPSGLARMHLHNFGFAWRDLLRRVGTGNPRAMIGGLWAIANGVVFHFFGRTLRLPFSHCHYDSFQTFSSMKRLLRQVGFAGGIHDVYVIRVKKGEQK